MIHLQSVTHTKFGAAPDSFPFHIPAIRSLDQLAFTAPVTFLVGENGSGKSTFLESLAVAAGSISAGSADLERDTTLKAAKLLASKLKLTWTKRTRKGLFLRAEDYFGYVKRLTMIREGLEQDLREIDEEYRGRSETAIGLAKMPVARELASLHEKYGGDLDERSHGESFLSFFKARFVADGLYLLDEPEAPLSPLRQLSLLSLLKEMVESHNAQFIIATHSPILMAFPGSVILSFDKTPIQAVNYDELEHVTLTRDFLNNPQAFVRHL
jgi:predicted ATPase